MKAKNKEIRIGLIGATFATNNMGVGALTDGIIKCILHCYKEPEIFLLDYGTHSKTYEYKTNGTSLSIELVNMRFSKKFYLRNNIAMLLLLVVLIRLVPIKNFRKWLTKKNYYLKWMSETNIFASIAGGDSFSDIYGLRRFFYVSLPQILVLLLGKELILLPQTFGPFNKAVVRPIVKYILKHSAIAYSRDYTGLDEIKSFLKDVYDPEKYRFCYDVGFVIEPRKPNSFEDHKFELFRSGDHQIVGLNISGLLFRGGYTQKNMFGLKVDYKKLMHGIIDDLIQRRNSKVILIPHVFGSSDDLESDSSACEIVYNELIKSYRNKIFLVRGTYNQNEIKHIIGHCDFFMGSRMHACIAAISQAIPTVALAYSKKFFGVMNSLGIDTIVADLRYLDEQEVLAKIENTFERKKTIHNQLLNKMPEIKEIVHNLFRNLTIKSKSEYLENAYKKC